MAEIYFDSEQEIYPDISDLCELVSESVDGALVYLGFTRECELSVTFTDNGKIRILNRDYRGIDRPTDVLSFPMYSFSDGDVPDGEEHVMLGDIVISVEKAREQAAEYGHSLRREIAFLAVHSVLHLLGYDHETSEEGEKEMFALQEKIMNALGIGRDS